MIIVNINDISITVLVVACLYLNKCLYKYVSFSQSDFFIFSLYHSGSENASEYTEAKNTNNINLYILTLITTELWGEQRFLLRVPHERFVRSFKYYSQGNASLKADIAKGKASSCN